MTITLEPDVRSLFVGVDEPVPTLDGDSIRYVNLDNAASTPAHVSVLAAIERFLPFYSSVHRGTGYKSRLSTRVYEQAREIVGNFVGADPSRDVVVFASNTTEAINKLARTMPIADDDVVVTTLLEHHSNDLPWRARGRTVRVRALADGSLDEDDLDRRLAEHAGRVALLAVSGASNVTGVVPPIHRLAEKVHAAGGRILVDAAQLAAHRPIDMRPHDDPGHLDFVALSAHKMYAPFGSGALIGPRAGFGSIPDHRGGGTVTTVTDDDVTWADLPDRAEAGSPNVIGAVALAAAVEALQAIGWDRIVAHETDLLRYTSARLADLPGVRLYGPSAADSPRVGRDPVQPRRGRSRPRRGDPRPRVRCRRTQRVLLRPSVRHPLTRARRRRQPRAWARRVRNGDKRRLPGMVRVSVGFYNRTTDIDRAVAGLEHIAAGGFSSRYGSDEHGEYRPLGYHEPALFTLACRRPAAHHSPRQPEAVDENPLVHAS